MDKDEIFYLVLDLLKGLIRIPRPSRCEKEATDYLEKWLERQNSGEFTITRIHNNLMVVPVTKDPSKPTILLNSHIDTVKPSESWVHDPFAATEEETDDIRIYGLGSNDAGASLVSLLGAFLFFLKSDIGCRYNLILVASAEEEVSGKNGFEAVKPFLPAVDFAIVGEPTEMNPAVAEKGLIVIDGVVKGRSGHAARNEGDNAIYKAMPVISTLRSLRFPAESVWLGPVKISVTQIEAGTQHNVVPDICRFVTDVRTIELFDNETTFRKIAESVPDYCRLTPRSLRLNPSSISLNNEVVQRLIVLGKNPFGSPTLSDQALMPWPSVKVGPGNSSRSHCADEFITHGEIREAVEIYTSILRH